MTNIILFDRDNIPEKVLLKLLEYTQNDEMRAEYIKTVSIAAHNIWMWILSVECYAWIKTGLNKEDHNITSEKE